MCRKASFALLAVLLLSSCLSQQQRAEQRQLTAQRVEQAVSSRHLKIEINSMQTLRYGTHPATSDFYLELIGDSLVSYLPFVGRAYGATAYGSPSQGLNFNSSITNFQQTPLKEDGVRMEMEVVSKEDHFFYRIDVYPNGKAYIYVRPQSRDAMNFDGEVVSGIKDN